MEIRYRMGKPDDANQIAELLHLASGGISDFLLDDILPNCEIAELIALGVTDKSSTISFSKTIVAEYNNEIVGILNLYPTKEHKIPAIMKTFIPTERINHLSELFSKTIPNSLYVHAFAVKKNMGYKVGKQFFHTAIAHAKKLNLNNISAHVWCNNKRFLNVLLKFGFQVSDKLYIPSHPALYYGNEMVLLSLPIT